VAILRASRLCRSTSIVADGDLAATKEGAASIDSVDQGCSRSRTTGVRFGSHSGASGPYGVASYSSPVPQILQSQPRFEFTIENFGQTVAGLQD
jgi:hypothetical protein